MTALRHLSLLLRLPSNRKRFVSLAGRNTRVDRCPSQLSWLWDITPEKLKKLVPLRRPSRNDAPEGFQCADRSIGMWNDVLSVGPCSRSPLPLLLPSLLVLWLNTAIQPTSHALHLGLKVHAGARNPPSPPDASKTCFWFLDHVMPGMKPRNLAGALGKCKNQLLLVVFLHTPSVLEFLSGRKRCRLTWY